jgi:hypothetical protein
LETALKKALDELRQKSEGSNTAIDKVIETGKGLLLCMGMTEEAASKLMHATIVTKLKANNSTDEIISFLETLTKDVDAYTNLYQELGYDPTTFEYKGKAASTEATQEEKPKLSFWGAVATFIGAVGAVIGLAPKKQEEGKEQQPEGWFRPVARWFAAAVVVLSGVEAAGRAFANKSLIMGPATALLKSKREATPPVVTPTVG